MMTVHKFLSMMMMFSTIDTVELRMRGVCMKYLDRKAVRQEEYSGFRSDHVLSFEVHSRRLILNLRPTF